jgi:hypothetical protein
MCRLGILFERLNTANVLDNKGAPLGSNSAVCMNLLIVLYTACIQILDITGRLLLAVLGLLRPLMYIYIYSRATITLIIVKNYVAVFCAGEGMHNQEQQC